MGHGIDNAAPCFPIVLDVDGLSKRANTVQVRFAAFFSIITLSFTRAQFHFDPLVLFELLMLGPIAVVNRIEPYDPLASFGDPRCADRFLIATGRMRVGHHCDQNLLYEQPSSTPKW